MLQFSGTTFLNTRYVDAYQVGQLRQRNEAGFSHTKVSGDIYTVILDPARNSKTQEVEKGLRTLAEEAAKKAGVPLRQIYHYSPKADISPRWEKQVQRRLKLEA